MAQQDCPSSLASVPAASDFIALADHESSTPSSFFGEKPVLHAAISVCDLLIADKDVARWEVFKDLLGHEATAEESTASDAASQSGILGMRVFGDIDGYITSSSVTLFHAQKQSSKAVSIPYPCISIHATQRLYRLSSGSSAQHSYSALPSSESEVDPSGEETAAIYLQLDMDPSARDRGNADDDEDGAFEERTVEILLVPQSDLLSPTNGTQNSSSVGNQEVNDGKVKEIFEALSRCADLHPDSSFAENEGGGGLASMFGFGSGGGLPGEGGWITAENAHEFEDQFGVDVDEYGEELSPDGVDSELGPGAGTRRSRQDTDENSQAGSAMLDGDHEEDGDTKWQRTG